MTVRGLENGGGSHMPGQPSNAGSMPRVKSLQHNDAIQVVWLSIPLVYACYFGIFRGLGSTGFVISAGALAAFGLIFGQRFIQAPLVFFASLAASYVALSYAGALDKGLTLLYDRSAIAQQSAYALALPFIIPAFAVYHQAVSLKKPAFVKLETFILILGVSAKLWDFILPTPDPITGDVVRQYAGISQFVNPLALTAFILTRRILETPGISITERRVLALMLLVTVTSAQATIAMATLVSLMLLPRFRRQFTTCFVLFLGAIPIILWPYAQQIWTLDPNTGIRLFFWNDVLDRVLSSGGIGVGFGTETIRPVYALQASDVTLVGIDDPGFIFIGSHNAFVDAGYRLGLLGFFTLIFYFTGLFRKILRQPNASLMDCWVICAIMTVLMVNVGLASINFLFGTAFFIGWVVYRASVVGPLRLTSSPSAGRL